MNIAFILAGGTDSRFQMDVPKQFVNVFNRPIIVYTMETFQKHPEVEVIVVACLDGWQEMVRAYAKQYNIDKLKLIITGGKNGQETSYRGVQALRDQYSPDDIIILHDAIRPMVSDKIISDSIKVCRDNGNGIAAVCSMDAIIKSSNGVTGDKSFSRREIMRIQTPQSYRLGLLEKAHERAKEQGIAGEWETSGVISKLGEKVYFSQGSDLNIKINTVEDVTMFKALYRMKKEEINE